MIAQAQRRGVRLGQIDDARLGLLVGQLHLGPHQPHRSGAARCADGRQDGQRDRRPLGPADQLNDPGERHGGHVDRRARGLRHRHDPVARLQLAAERGRSAGDQLVNRADAVLVGQRGADAEQRKIHGDGQRLHGFLAHVVRMRVVDVRQRVQVDLQHLVVAQRADRAQLLLVTVNQCPGHVGDRLVGQLLLQHLGPQRLLPQLARGGQVGRALGVLAVEGEAVVAGERETAGSEQGRVERDLLLQPLDVTREDDVRRSGVAVRPGRLGQGGAHRAELGHVALEKQ